MWGGPRMNDELLGNNSSSIFLHQQKYASIDVKLHDWSKIF